MAHAGYEPIDKEEEGGRRNFLSQLQDPGSVEGATLNLAIATVGAGLLALPMAFADAGIVLGMSTLIVVAVFTVISIRFLTQAISVLHLNSYEDIARELLCPVSETACRYMLVTYNLAAAISYVVIVGQLFEPLQGYVTAVFPMLSTSKHTMVAFWFVVMLPMSLIRNISSLRYSSFCAIGAAVYIALAIVYRYYEPNEAPPAVALHRRKLHYHFHHHHHDNTTTPSLLEQHLDPLMISFFAWNGALTLLSMPVLMYSYDCQVLVFEIFHSLSNRGVAKMTRVAAGSVIIVSLLYATVGLFGYLSHGQYVQDNILNNYDPNTDMIFAFGYAAYAMPIVMAYTLMLFPTRDSIFNKMYGYSAGNEDIIITDTVYRVTSVTLSVITILVAVVLPGIVGMIALVGGLCSSTLTLIIPAAFRIRLHTTGALPAVQWERRAMYAMLAMGVFGAIFGTFVGAVKAFGLASH